MNRTTKIIVSIFVIILGWLFCGIGYAEPLPYPINTILFCLGLIMCPGGIIYFFITAAKNEGKTLAQKIQILNFKKMSPNWNSNLYAICLSEIKSIQSYKYFYKQFRSWEIETKQNKLVYDGEHSQLILQVNDLEKWKNSEIIKKEDLKDLNLFALLNKI